MRSFGRLAPVLFLLAAPLLAHAALVDLNTAGSAELESLPGIGPSKASAIIQYRTDHGPFVSTESVENVSGIGPSTFAEIEALVTIGAAEGVPDVSTSSPPFSPPAAAANTEAVPPPTVSVSITSDPTVYLHVPHRFSAAASAGTPIVWNFGDGSTGEGTAIEKTYQYPGTYLVTVTATGVGALVSDEQSVTVRPVDAAVAAVTMDGTTIANNLSVELDLSGWRLSQGGALFRFPQGSVLPPNMRVLFPSAVTGLPVAFDTELRYPDGTLAARYLPSASTTPAGAVSAQPQTTSAGSTQLKGSVVTSISVPTHEDPAVNAPTAATDTSAAVGAAVATGAAATASTPLSGLLHSSWAYGFLGVLAVAGGAFLIL